jgi:glycerol-3-phosphate dehydrogenase
MRARDLDRLAAAAYDLLVIGGGIHGLAIAYDAADRGLRTALIDAADFGGGASFNHQKTAHGGLRALQSASLGRARESIRERRALARIAPRLLRPLPFVVGTYRSITRSRLALRTAFTLDAWLGRDRSAGLEPELQLPPPRLLSKAATLRLFPGIRQQRLTGGAQWYDYQMVESERLTFAFAEAADRAGADLATYVEAIAPVRRGPAVAGVEARDRLTGALLTIHARATVNAAGAHAGRVMAAFGVTREFLLLKAMNLLTSRPARDIALAAPTAAGRMLTLVPWRARALVGTSQSPGFVQPGDTNVTAREVQAFVAEANDAFPTLHLTAADVTLVHRGVLPAMAGRNGRPELRPTPEIRDHAADGVKGAFTVIGVKYTTARGVAERVTARVAGRLGKRVPPSQTGRRVLPGGGIADHEALALETARRIRVALPAPAIAHLIERYGERSADLITLMGEREDLRAHVSTTTPTLGAEVVHAIRREMAVRLTDIVIRRTALGAAGHPGDDAVHGCARIAAAELGWDERRTEEEIAAVDAFYEIDNQSAEGG